MKNTEDLIILQYISVIPEIPETLKLPSFRKDNIFIPYFIASGHGQDRFSITNEYKKGLITDYRTFIDDLYKVLEFVEWYKEWY